METTQRIGARSFMILTFFFMTGTSILIAPAGLAVAAGRDAWLAALLGVSLNLATAGIYIALAERHNGQTLVQIAMTVLGRWPGMAVGCLFSLFCYLLAALMVGDMGFFMTSQILAETPIEAIEVLFVCAVVLAIRSGLRSYALAGEIFFAWVALLMVLFMIPLIPDFDARRLLPILDQGMMPVVKGGASFFALQELSVLLMIYPYVTPGKGRRRGLIVGTAIGGSALVLLTLGCIGVLEENLTANNLYPVYTLAKNIKIGRFLERIEGIMIFIWICSIFLKIALTFHASLIGLAQTFRIGDIRVLLWPLAIGLIWLSLASYPNEPFIVRVLSTSWLPFASLFLIVIPLLLLGASFLSKRKRAAGE